MNEQDIQEETKEKINTFLNDLHELPKYKIINALLVLTECALRVGGQGIVTDEVVKDHIRVIDAAFDATKSQEEWHPGSVIEKKKGNVVSLFRYAA